jgi:hypothetical protein
MDTFYLAETKPGKLSQGFLRIARNCAEFALMSSSDGGGAQQHKIPLLTIRAGPRDGDQWLERLKQEYKALIKVGSVIEFTK